MGRRVYSVTEIAKELGVSRSMAYRLIESGEIPSVRLGGRILIPKAELDRMFPPTEEGTNALHDD